MKLANAGTYARTPQNFFARTRPGTYARTPNRLLGRPNGYTSKIAFADSRISKTDTDGRQKDAIERGGSIEVLRTRTRRRAALNISRASLRTAGWGQSTTTYADLFCGSRVTSAQARLQTMRWLSADGPPRPPAAQQSSSPRSITGLMLIFAPGIFGSGAHIRSIRGSPG